MPTTLGYFFITGVNLQASCRIDSGSEVHAPRALSRLHAKPLFSDSTPVGKTGMIINLLKPIHTGKTPSAL